MPRVSDLAFAVASSRGKLELTMTEEEGHEDKLIHRIIDEAIKNIFTAHFDLRELRPIVDYFENGQSVEIGDALPSAAVLERIGKVPGLRKRADELAARWIASSAIASCAKRRRRARPSSCSKACTCTTRSTSRPRPAAHPTGAYGDGDFRVLQVGRLAGVSAAIGRSGLRPACRIPACSTATGSCRTWTISRTRFPRSSS